MSSHAPPRVLTVDQAPKEVAAVSDFLWKETGYSSTSDRMDVSEPSLPASWQHLQKGLSNSQFP